MEIKIYKYPKDTKDLLIRDFDPNLIGEAVSAISDIINDIEENGDTALLKYERQFDCPSIESLKVTEQEFEEAEAAVSQELKDAMKVAADNIRKFHTAQLMEPIEVETRGVPAESRAAPLRRTICAWRQSAFVFNGTDACHPGTPCRMPRDCHLHASRQERSRQPDNPCGGTSGWRNRGV